ncbi:6590_t:CDS:2, partial [Acaulospora morrowiae]
MCIRSTIHLAILCRFPIFVVRGEFPFIGTNGNPIAPLEAIPAWRHLNKIQDESVPGGCIKIHGVELQQRKNASTRLRNNHLIVHPVELFPQFCVIKRQLGDDIEFSEAEAETLTSISFPG